MNCPAAALVAYIKVTSGIFSLTRSPQLVADAGRAANMSGAMSGAMMWCNDKDEMFSENSWNHCLHASPTDCVVHFERVRAPQTKTADWVDYDAVDAAASSFTLMTS